MVEMIDKNKPKNRIEFLEMIDRMYERMTIIWKFLVDYLLEDKIRLQRVTELRDKVLGCFRVPLPCHAHTLFYLAENPDTLQAALLGTKTKEEIAKEIFAFYKWTLPHSQQKLISFCTLTTKEKSNE